MTNAQLFFSAGFPTLVIVIGFLWQGHRFDAIQKQMDVRFEAVNQRFEAVHQQLVQISARITSIEGDLRQFYRDLGNHDKAIERLEAKGN